MTEINIHLDEDNDAGPVVPDRLICKKELESVFEMISKTLSAASSTCAGFDKVRRHDAIMIEGERGSGKSTFMLTLLKAVNNPCESRGSFGVPVPEGLVVLGVLDPTTIEEKVHAFLHIVSMIKGKVEDKAKKFGWFEENRSSYGDWQESLRKLSAGLPALKGVGGQPFDGESWHDPEYAMEVGERKAKAARDLEDNFTTYVDKSLTILNGKAFILCFDDIDTHFGKGWPVLRLLHRYLTTPKLIIVISGDPNLYSILIRGKQWENFEERLLKYEAVGINGKDPYKGIVTHLEEQYFLKILKSERRVTLKSLYQKAETEKAEVNIFLASSKWENLRDSYDQLFGSLGIEGTRQRGIFYRFLASSPIRTQVQLLHTFKMAGPSAPTDDYGFGWEFANRLVQIFWSDLSNQQIDCPGLRYDYPNVNSHAVKYLIKNDRLSNGNSFQAVFPDRTANGAQFALGGMLALSTTGKPELVFDFLVRIGLTREITISLPANVVGSASEAGRSVEDFAEYCSLYEHHNASHVARVATIYLKALFGEGSTSPFSVGTSHGAISLYTSRKSAKKGRSNDQVRYDDVLTFGNGAGKQIETILGLLPLLEATDHKGFGAPVYSFHAVLGILADLLTSDDEDDLSKKLHQYAQVRAFPTPLWYARIDSGGDKPGTEPIPTEDESIGNETETTDFSRGLLDWKKKFSNIGAVAPYLLAKAYTRFFYTLDSMDKELGKTVLLGEWLHRMTVAFLNSVLVVEAMETPEVKAGDFSLKNPVSDDVIFRSNLKKLKENRELLPFSKWLFACPIWPYYIHAVITEENKDWFANKVNPSLKERLDTISIRHRDSVAGSTKKGNPGTLFLDKPQDLNIAQRLLAPYESDWMNFDKKGDFETLLSNVSGGKYSNIKTQKRLYVKSLKTILRQSQGNLK